MDNTGLPKLKGITMMDIANMLINKMQVVLPEKWVKVCLFYQIEERSYSGKFFVFIEGSTQSLGMNELQKYYSISSDKIDLFFKEVYNCLYPTWKRLGEEGREPFTHYTLVFDTTDFHEYYDYSQLSNSYGFYDYLIDSKKKFLNTDKVSLLPHYLLIRPQFR